MALMQLSLPHTNLISHTSRKNQYHPLPQRHLPLLPPSSPQLPHLTLSHRLLIFSPVIRFYSFIYSILLHLFLPLKSRPSTLYPPFFLPSFIYSVRLFFLKSLPPSLYPQFFLPFFFLPSSPSFPPIFLNSFISSFLPCFTVASLIVFLHHPRVFRPLPW